MIEIFIACTIAYLAGMIPVAFTLYFRLRPWNLSSDPVERVIYTGDRDMTPTIRYLSDREEAHREIRKYVAGWPIFLTLDIFVESMLMLVKIPAFIMNCLESLARKLVERKKRK